mmetsp:Transcript_45342/g.111412  ORF Transcript_45342/g.111412 Transcript_45342/m.111412 type:complete len:336 (+) Transcript_45342:32-1039(+)
MLSSWLCAPSAASEIEQVEEVFLAADPDAAVAKIGGNDRSAWQLPAHIVSDVARPQVLPGCVPEIPALKTAASACSTASSQWDLPDQDSETDRDSGRGSGGSASPVSDVEVVEGGEVQSCVIDSGREIRCVRFADEALPMSSGAHGFALGGASVISGVNFVFVSPPDWVGPMKTGEPVRVEADIVEGRVQHSIYRKVSGGWQLVDLAGVAFVRGCKFLTQRDYLKDRIQELRILIRFRSKRLDACMRHARGDAIDKCREARKSLQELQDELAAAVVAVRDMKGARTELAAVYPCRSLEECLEADRLIDIGMQVLAFNNTIAKLSSALRPWRKAKQ